MKWTNKGHQYDGTGQRLAEIESIYLYGAGEQGRILCSLLQPLGCVQAFIDADEGKQAAGCMGVPVLAPLEFLRQGARPGSMVVVTPQNPAVSQRMVSRCVAAGYREGADLFLNEPFSRLYLGLYTLYRHEKVCLHSYTSFITQKCSLRCKACSARIPYIENPRQPSLEEIKEKQDFFFGEIDMVKTYFLTGGEAFLHPQLYEIIEYVMDRYQDRFGQLCILTNGFSNVEERLYPLLKHPKVTVGWTNYLRALEEKPAIAEKTRKTIQGLRQQGVAVIENVQEAWADFGFEDGRKYRSGNEETAEFFDNCFPYCTSLQKNELYSCGIGTSIGKAKFGRVIDENLWGLVDGPRRKFALFEVFNGFTPSGFLESCKFCKGYHANAAGLLPGEQIG